MSSRASLRSVLSSGRGQHRRPRKLRSSGLYSRPLRFESLEDRRLLSVLTVLNSNDSGAGSLRAAILDAAPGDTIQFVSNLAGQTINLTSGVLEISKPLTIQGFGAGQLTVDGRYNGSGLPEGVFWVDSTVTATISGLTISRGFASTLGGGIYNAGHLTVTNCTFSGNVAGSSGGGIYFDGSYGGTLNVNRSTFVNNSGGSWGGGISYVDSSISTSTLTVTSCTFSGNHASWGGGIYVQHGTTTVSDSTIAGTSVGEGISVNPGTITITGTTISANDDGGIYNSGILTLVNSTVSGNGSDTYYGGGINNRGTLTVQDSTIARNSASGYGGGIYRGSGTVTLVNTIVAQNANGASPDIYGPATANFCLIGNTAGATISGTGNILNQDPLLAWLADYGGPTQTMPLLAGSPAIDHGSNTLIPSGVVTDQRGWRRVWPTNDTVDIGACENQPDPATQDALERQVYRLSPATFDGAGADINLWLGDVTFGQQVQVYVGQTLQDLRPVGTFVNNAGRSPWLLPIDIHTARVPLAEYVAVGSDTPILILSAVGLHPNLTDLSAAGYQHYPAVAGSESQPQNGDYTNIAQLLRWDWSAPTPDFVPLQDSQWWTIDWSKPTIILTHGWNGSMDEHDKNREADYIWAFAQDFMAAPRTLAQCEGYNILAVDWYADGSRYGSDPNNIPLDAQHPLEAVNILDAWRSATNGIAAAKALADRLVATVGANLDPQQMMLVGHSNGAAFVASLAIELQNRTGTNVLELDALEAPVATDAWNNVKSAAGSVDHVSNYYVPGVAAENYWTIAFGKVIDGLNNVTNFSLNEVLSMEDIAASGIGLDQWWQYLGHFVVPERYARTAHAKTLGPNPSWGFQESAFMSSDPSHTSSYDSSPYWVEETDVGNFVSVARTNLTGEELKAQTEAGFAMIVNGTYSVVDTGVRVAQDISQTLKGMVNGATLWTTGVANSFLIHFQAHSPVYGSIDVNVPTDADVLTFNLSVANPGNNDHLLVMMGNDVVQDIDLASVQAVGSVTEQVWTEDYAGQQVTVSFYMPSPDGVTSTAEFSISDVNFVDVNFPPVASADSNSVTIGNSTATFAVTYADPDDAVLLSKVGNDNIRVTGPNEFDQPASLVSAVPNGDGTSVTATYRIDAPNGAWGAEDAGDYVVWMQSDQVSDISGNNYVAPGALGVFTVSPNPDMLLGDYNDDGIVDVLDYCTWRNHLGQAIQLPNEDPTVTPGQVTEEDFAVWKTHFGDRLPPELLGDYNNDNIVDVLDYCAWRNTEGTNVARYSGADGSGNGVIDEADFVIWKENFGHTLPTGSGASAASVASAPMEPAAEAKVESPPAKAAPEVRESDAAITTTQPPLLSRNAEVDSLARPPVTELQPAALPARGVANFSADVALSGLRTESEVLFISSFLTDSRSVTSSRRLNVRMQEADVSPATRQDDLLLAWLASRWDRAPGEDAAGVDVFTPSDEAIGEVDDAPLEAFDVAFDWFGRAKSLALRS